MKRKNSKKNAALPDKRWQKTQYTNLIRYVPSGKFYARLRVKGKLIRKSLKTDVLSIAKLRLGDFEQIKREAAEQQDQTIEGKMTFGERPRHLPSGTVMRVRACQKAMDRAAKVTKIPT